MRHKVWHYSYTCRGHDKMAGFERQMQKGLG